MTAAPHAEPAPLSCSSGGTGLAALQVALAAQRSADENRTITVSDLT